MSSFFSLSDGSSSQGFDEALAGSLESSFEIEAGTDGQARMIDEEAGDIRVVDLCAVDLGAEGLSAVDAGAEGLGAVDLGAEGLSAVDAGAEGLGAVDLGAEGLSAVDAGAEGLGAEGVGAVGGLDTANVGATSLGAAGLAAGFFCITGFAFIGTPIAEKFGDDESGLKPSVSRGGSGSKNLGGRPIPCVFERGRVPEAPAAETSPVPANKARTARHRHIARAPGGERTRRDELKKLREFIFLVGATCRESP